MTRAPRSRPEPFRALRVRNYRLSFIGQILSVIALATALVVSAGRTSTAVLGAMSLLAGTAAAFETPTRQSLAAELVPPDVLPSAIGLNGAIMTSSRLVGTAIAGLLIALVGAATCLHLNAVSFLAVVVAMRLMRRSELFAVSRATRARGQIRPGLRYAAGEPEARRPLVALAVVGTLALNQQVTTPLLARLTFHAGPALFGGHRAGAEVRRSTPGPGAVPDGRAPPGTEPGADVSLPAGG